MIVDLCAARVFVEIVGNVEKCFVEMLLHALRDVYCSVGADIYVELLVYASRSEKLARLSSEARELGVVAFGDFKTLHEAWRGYPRIHVSVEDLRDMDSEVVKALVAHEAMHSVLHGTVSSYVVYIPREMIEKATEMDLLDELYAVAYLLASTIKDLEVHREMVRRGLRKYLELYAEFCASQLSETCCAENCDPIEIANSLKLLTPFYVLSRDPPRCSELLRSPLFEKLVSSTLDDVHEVVREVFAFVGLELQ